MSLVGAAPRLLVLVLVRALLPPAAGGARRAAAAAALRPGDLRTDRKHVTISGATGNTW